MTITVQELDDVLKNYRKNRGLGRVLLGNDKHVQNLIIWREKNLSANPEKEQELNAHELRGLVEIVLKKLVIKPSKKKESSDSKTTKNISESMAAFKSII